GGQADGGASDGGASQQQQPEEGMDGGSSDGGTSDGGSQAQSEEQEPPKDVDRQRAEQLLDAIRRNEKQFLMHQQQEQKKGRVRVPERDW
ncbi:MAG: aerotolerance regulator BatC, partial [Myxococcales bacterium]